jgi:multidrug efflux pump subunit AcrA (membrane-fusion protein)
MLQTRIGRAALALFTVAALVPAARAESKMEMTFSGVNIITQPSYTRKVSFPLPGIVKESLIKDGDVVKAGQVLMRQDTDLDEKEAERLKVEAESESRIEAAKADMEVKKIDYDIKSTGTGHAYSASEINEARAKLTEAEKSVKVAEEDHQQAKIKYDQQLVRLTKMEMKAPADVQGEWIVDHIVTNVGEMADPQSRDGVIVLVKNDPLDVEIRGLTTRQVATLKNGEKLQVRYLNDGPNDWKEAAVDYIQPVALADADRQKVKLKLPNPDGRYAGLRMELKLTKALQDTAPKDDAFSASFGK